MDYVDKVKKGNVEVPFQDKTSGYLTAAEVTAQVNAALTPIETRLSNI